MVREGLPSANEVQKSNADTFYDTLIKTFPKKDSYSIINELPGPMRNLDLESGHAWKTAWKTFMEFEKLGRSHIAYAHWQKELTGSLSSNIVVPQLVFQRENDNGKSMRPEATFQVIVSHPDDAARIARIHVQKQPNFTMGLYSSIISTTDNEHWVQQREHIVPAFLPQASLRKVFPVTANRARACVEKLKGLARDGPVDMSEFLLFEAEAQLQLSLFGEDNEFMERTNAQFRGSMAGKNPPGYARTFCKELVSRFPRESNTCPMGSGGAVHGPLANALASFETDSRTDEGNALIFAFAGHDTTGHTMSWLLYELSRHPDHLMRLQSEVDDLFERIGDRELVYDDLFDLQFMTRCIMETLRLWPAVANGTFREIQFDDYITGPDGKDVLIKKGTHVQIANWSRHRNPELWGPDANEFSPDREFKNNELWNGSALAGYNPASERFSPFTFPPRDCIGKNFAHMEARAIIANLLHHFTFSLTQPWRDNQNPEELGVNYGTLAPRDLSSEDEFVKGFAGWAPTKKVPAGLMMHVVPREQAKL